MVATSLQTLRVVLSGFGGSLVMVSTLHFGDTRRASWRAGSEEKEGRQMAADRWPTGRQTTHDGYPHGRHSTVSRALARPPH